MMINSHSQLNSFSQKAGVKNRGELLDKLIESKEIINHNIAELVIRADSALLLRSLIQQ